MTWCAPAFSQVPTWCASENVVINGARWPPYEKYYCTCCDTRGTLFLFLFKRDPRLIVDYRRSAAKAVQDGTSRLTRDPLASDALHSPAAQILKMHGSWSCSRSTRQCNDEHGMAMATRSVPLHPNSLHQLRKTTTHKTWPFQLATLQFPTSTHTHDIPTKGTTHVHESIHRLAAHSHQKPTPPTHTTQSSTSFRSTHYHPSTTSAARKPASASFSFSPIQVPCLMWARASARGSRLTPSPPSPLAR